MIEVGCRNCGNTRDINKKCELCTEDDDLPVITETEFIEYDLEYRESNLKSDIYIFKENIELHKENAGLYKDFDEFVNDLKISIHFQRIAIQEIKKYIKGK